MAMREEYNVPMGDVQRGTVAAGYSRQKDPARAIAEAAGMIKAKIKDAKVDTAIILYDFDAAAEERLREAIRMHFMPRHFLAVKATPLIAEGEVFAGGVCVAVVSGAPSTSGGFSGSSNTREQIEKTLWQMAQSVPRQKRFYLGAASIGETESSNFVKGIEVGVGKKASMINIFYDPESAEKSVRFFYPEGSCAEGAAGLYFYDPVSVCVKSGNGFQPLGSSCPIEIGDEHRDHIVKIAGADAVDFYRKYFGDKLLEDVDFAKRVFRRYPLGVKKTDFYYDVIKPRGIKDRTALRFFQDVHGEEARLMIPTRDGILLDVRSAGLRIRERSESNKVVLFFDTLERKRFFGTEYGRCVAAVKDTLGDAVMIGGVFYALGFVFDSDDVSLGHSISEHAFALMGLSA